MRFFPGSTVVAAMLFLSLTTGTALAAVNFSPTFSTKPFTDVPVGSSSYQAIEYLRMHNILKGYDDGTYGPNQRLRRNELTQLMTNEFFLSSRDNSCINTSSPDADLFPDVPSNDGYATDICNAKVNGIVNGYLDGYFRPRRTVSFVEAAKVVTRVLRLSTDQTDPTDPRWYTIYVNALSSANAIPKSIRYFDQPITRAELAEIIYRLKTNTTDKPSAHFNDLRLR